MKALLFLILVVLCVCLGSQQGNELKSVEMDQLLLSNVEALANGEVDIPYICQGNIKACYDDYYNQFYWGIKLY